MYSIKQIRITNSYSLKPFKWNAILIFFLLFVLCEMNAKGVVIWSTNTILQHIENVIIDSIARLLKTGNRTNNHYQQEKTQWTKNARMYHHLPPFIHAHTQTGYKLIWSCGRATNNENITLRLSTIRMANNKNKHIIT